MVSKAKFPICLGMLIGFLVGVQLAARLKGDKVEVGDIAESSIKPTVPPSDKCLDLQVSSDIHNRIIPTPNQTDKCLLYHPPPSDFVQLVMNFVVGTPNQGKCAGKGGCSEQAAYVEVERLYGNDWPPFGYTMIGKQRLENFRAAIHEVDQNNIPGATI